MDRSTMERIKILQKTNVMSKEQREAVKNEIINIVKNSSIDDVREMLGNNAKVHAIVIQKGGVGKSTASSDICYTLASMGFDVLGIDSDPQASLSMLSNVDTEDDTMYGLQDVYYAHFDAMANGNIAVDAEEAEIVKRIFADRISGLSGWKIAIRFTRS